MGKAAFALREENSKRKLGQRLDKKNPLINQTNKHIEKYSNYEDPDVNYSKDNEEPPASIKATLDLFKQQIEQNKKEEI